MSNKINTDYEFEGRAAVYKSELYQLIREVLLTNYASPKLVTALDAFGLEMYVDGAVKALHDVAKALREDRQSAAEAGEIGR